MKLSSDQKVLLSLFVLAGVVSLFGTQFDSVEQYVRKKNVQQVATVYQAPPTITLGFVGDVMLDRGVKYMVDKYMDGDYNELFTQTEFLKEPDIMFANLEGPISDVGENVGSKYSFRMEPKTIPTLKASGIDIVSFANNHVGDWTRDAFTDTINRLHNAGILTCGAGFTYDDAISPTIIEQQGYRVGYLCASDVGPGFMEATSTQSGILLASNPNLGEIVKNAKHEVNTLIVSFHWGEEYEPEHSDRQEYLAKLVIANGADLVIGHHPHVIQDIREYDGVPVVYSLGNFIFDQAFSEETMEGLFMKTEIKDGLIGEIEGYKTQLSKWYVPRLR